MCNICYAEKNGISIIDTNTDTLCFDHYVDWSNEKAVGEDWN